MATFKLSGSRLIIRGDLDDEAEIEMRDRCGDLLALPAQEGAESVIVDLSKVGRLTSMCVGTLVALWIDLREAGRSGRIIPSQSVMRVFELAGLTEVLLKPPPGKKAKDSGRDENESKKEGDEDGDQKHGGGRRAKF